MENINLQVVYLDLANVQGSVPHQLLWNNIRMFHVSGEVLPMLKTCFSGFSLRFSNTTFTTSWIELQMGCTTSPFLFVMARQDMLDRTNCYVPARAKPDEKTLPVVRVFIDVTTILTADVSYAKDMLARLDERITWCVMSSKLKKCSDVCR